MGTLERIKRILSSNINELLDSVENPDKIVKQMILDMDESVKEARKEVAVSMVHLKKLELRAKQYEEEAQKWQTHAEFAVRRGDDGLAREALKKKLGLLKKHEEHQEQINSQNKALESLLPSLNQLEDRLAEVRRQKNIIIAKKKMAQILPAMGLESASSLKNGAALDAWSHMVEKIEEMEISAEAVRELNQRNDKDLDAEIELLKLKKDMEEKPE